MMFYNFSLIHCQAAAIELYEIHPKEREFLESFVLVPPGESPMCILIMPYTCLAT